MYIVCLCKAMPRVSVDRYPCFGEGAASIVRERLEASHSNKYWAAQCAKYKVYSRLQGKLQIVSYAEKRLPTKLQGTTTLWVISWTGYSPVSEYRAAWSMYYIYLVIAACVPAGRHTVNSGQEKIFQGFSKILPNSPPHTIVFPPTHFLIHKPAYSKSSNNNCVRAISNP